MSCFVGSTWAWAACRMSNSGNDVLVTKELQQVGERCENWGEQFSPRRNQLPIPLGRSLLPTCVRERLKIIRTDQELFEGINQGVSLERRQRSEKNSVGTNLLFVFTHEFLQSVSALLRTILAYINYGGDCGRAFSVKIEARDQRHF